MSSTSENIHTVFVLERVCLTLGPIKPYDYILGPINVMI